MGTEEIRREVLSSQDSFAWVDFLNKKIWDGSREVGEREWR